jgi:hypothetical protein
MKRFAFITVFLACLLTLRTASAADTSVEIMQFHQDGQGSASYMLKRSHADKLPRWNEGSGEPPLAQRRAIDIAIAELKNRGLKLEGLELHSVSLTRIKELPVEGHWFYGVTFSPIAGGVTKPYWKSMVLVLMDGTVVNPVESPK